MDKGFASTAILRYLTADNSLPSSPVQSAAKQPASELFAGELPVYITQHIFTRWYAGDLGPEGLARP